MNEAAGLEPIFIIGVSLGTVFFGGHWWSVKNRFSSKRSPFRFIGGTVLQLSVTLSGFYLVVQGHHWERLPVCITGFVIARCIVTRLTRTTGKSTHPTKEITLAP
jgi:F1F0 ATPase subunit 2